MSRQLSANLLAELYGQNSSDPFLMLVTLSHTSFTTLYLVNNTANITSRLQKYTAFPMKITLPIDDGESLRSVKMQFDNVSLELIDEIRTVTDPIDVKLEMVLASNPDVVEIEYDELKISNIAYDAQSIRADLIFDDFLNTGMTSERYTPTLYAGIFS